MIDQPSDAQLMERVRDLSDPEAFRALASRWRPRLNGYFRPLLAEPAAVEDAVQEVLVGLWTRRADYRSTARFSAWALAAARHHWLNLRRREVRRTTAELVESLEPAGAATEPLVLARADQRRLAAAVAELSPGQRQVWALVTDQGAPLAEAAARLAVPVGTVKSRLHSARQAVRAALEEDDDA